MSERPEAIKSGDEVVVTITGTISGEVLLSGTFDLRTADNQLYDYITEGVGVKVTVLRPDRPTRREVLDAHTPVISLGGDSIPAIIGCRCEMPGLVRHGIQWTSYWHPEHLDAVLTKWEQS